MAIANLLDITQDWFWEGNVTKAVACFLVRAGWSIISSADTRSKERGVDIHARKGATDLLIEVKGYPATTYRDPRRAGERKPTQPTNQAQHWYSHALLKALRLRTAHPEAVVAIALPDFPRYRRLFEETHISLQQLGIATLFVPEGGELEVVGCLHAR